MSKTSESNEVPAWYWDQTHKELVRREMMKAPDGSYCVFHEGNVEYHTLAHRLETHVEFVPILYREKLFGFTEPLGFESLLDALDAYNSSPTKSGNTLRKALAKPVLTKPEEEPVKVLRNLRHLSKLMTQREQELNQMMTCIEKLENDIEEQKRQIDAFTALSSMLDSQKEKCYRLSQGAKDGSLEFVTNQKMLHSKAEEVHKQITELHNRKTHTETEKENLSREYDKRTISVQKLEDEINEHKETLMQIALYENSYDIWRLFMDRLLEESPESVPPTQVWKEKRRWAKKALRGKEEGTYIVLMDTAGEGFPEILVSYSDGDDKKVAGFSVKKSDGYYGFENDTCIFESIHDLVVCYSRVPFSVHGNYGNLTLTTPYRESTDDDDDD